MDKLLDDVLILIFNLLDLDHLIINCKPVCKRWLSIINHINFKELVVKNADYDCYFLNNNCWYHLNKPIDLKNTVCLYDMNFIYLQSFINHFSKLKHLKLSNDGNFELELINHFIQIEHFELDNPIVLKKDSILHLPNLNSIRILFTDQYLTIISNNLENISIYHLRKLKIPEECYNRVKCIEVYSYLNENMSLFSNLEVFKCEIMNESLIYSLPNSLKRLYLENFHNSQCLPMLKLIMSEKKLGLINIEKLFCDSVQIIDEESIEDFKNNFGNDRHIKFKKYFSLYDNSLGKKFDFIDIQYKDLMSQNAFNHRLPENFFKKFTSIQRVYLRNDHHKEQPVDQSAFLNFLKNCPVLTLLALNYCGLNQAFFEQLSKNCPLIKNFSLYEDEKYELDLQFVLKFPLLKQLTTTLYLDSDLLFKFASKLKMLIKFDAQIIRPRKWICVEISRPKNKVTFTEYHYLWTNLSMSEFKNLCLDFKRLKGFSSSNLYIEKKSNRKK